MVSTSGKSGALQIAFHICQPTPLTFAYDISYKLSVIDFHPIRYVLEPNEWVLTHVVHMLITIVLIFTILGSHRRKV